MTANTEITITGAQVEVYRHPVSHPVATSFGVMRDRPAVFLRLEAADGAFGWGEIFANWPAAGAEHRARLLIEDMGDLLKGQSFASPEAAFESLTRATHIRALQSGEWGPFRQVIAGIDTALHDLVARRAGRPLRQMLSDSAADAVPAYASGIAIRDAERMIPEARALGFNRFKVKVGFDDEADRARLAECLDMLEGDEILMMDANQAWDRTRALRFINAVADPRIGWIEEPIPADAPEADWQALREASEIPLAGGENLAGFDGFAEALARRQFTFYQPDVAKWGGVTGCLRVARDVLGAGATYCPHFLGGLIGLQASAGLLAAAGGPGWLEIDVNPNPLRGEDDWLAARMQAGDFRLSDGTGSSAGLGLDSPCDGFGRMRTLTLTL
ncbi:mandelate racemase/muconate lactonizing enzyme family protein [Roseovarius sp. CH_XMU1461]|uniref:mandelate racemase/muconate lactonizing enzyme family protein n=1 Tax=Roseovarius sp. CH_XMU1461 TaxID=3107777 RepID=UPI00300B4284